MSVDTAEPAAAERRATPPSVVVSGLCLGLLIASALCLVVAWQRLGAASYVGTDHDALLWRTTVVVSACGVLAVLYLAPWGALGRSSERLSRFLALTSAVPAVVALSGVMSLHRGSTEKLFDALAYAQQAVNGPVVTAPAREAWWLACLAVAAAALVAFVGHRPREPQEEPTFRWPSGRVATAVLSVVTASVLVIPLVLSDQSVAQTVSPPPSERGPLAQPVGPAPTPTVIDGEVVYRTGGIPFDARVAAAGPGFVTVVGGEEAGPVRVQAYDGPTGALRWTSQLAEPEVEIWNVAGTGTDSVIVLDVAQAVLGIDATTGEHLWRHDLAGPGEVYLQVSSDVVLLIEDGSASSERKTALSARTGAHLWTHAARDDCSASWRLGDIAVLAPVCDPARPDVAARLLDPQTGEERDQILLSALGIDAEGLRRNFGDAEPKEARGSIGIIEVSRVQPTREATDLLVSLDTGRLLVAAPAIHNAYLTNSESVVLFGPGDTGKGWLGSILDIPSKAVTSIGLYTRGTGGWSIHPQVIPVGAEWITSLSTAAEADKKPGEPSLSPLRMIDPSGNLRTLPAMCAPTQTPALAALAPGALLVRCGDEVVGIH
ncbi:hypothetical protein FHR72_000319 [Mycolicibacterium iranicum]|uniref:Pyrrolo-quinoline quinone repeat domain-containing protein n=1 Tax=Mycolicibacterium iranicum TaxID=912594 RepID=A0A839Q6Q2_MYCIR|nr:PQQ-binding-like beta-propeller repeat protein [Mycolicibacterium iranicum]MBB2988862.1 hypothetical protein [Mycolicibacterium iranicum]